MNFGTPSPSKPPKKKKQKTKSQVKMAAAQGQGQGQGQSQCQDDVLIERAHRIGRPNDNRPRPIVAKFSRFPQREVVRKSAFKLKGANISIGEQFPKIIQERRKKLLPVMKEAKDRQQKAVLIKDKLFIDGKPYHPPATEADHLDAPVPAQGAEGHSSPGGRWERRDTRGGGRGRRTR